MAIILPDYKLRFTFNNFNNFICSKDFRSFVGNPYRMCRIDYTWNSLKNCYGRNVASTFLTDIHTKWKRNR